MGNWTVKWSVTNISYYYQCWKQMCCWFQPWCYSRILWWI